MNGIDFLIEDSIATITLNRQEVFNSFNTAMAKALQQCLDDCDTNENVRVVLLTASGKAFCAGQDLKEILGDNSIPVTQIVEENYNPIILKIRQLSKPVVIAVNGIAAGAGANIALAGDIVVAKASAHFVQAFSKIGLIPDCGGTYFLPRLIGPQMAAALMMTADKVTAKEAVEMGMIFRAYPDEDFEMEVKTLVEKIASMPTKGLYYTKLLLNDTFSRTLPEQLSNEAAYQTRAAATADFAEGVSAFIEKRIPTFTGK